MIHLFNPFRLLLPFFMIVMFMSTVQVHAQNGYLEMLGNVLQEGRAVEGVKINTIREDGVSDQQLSTAGGKFTINLDLGHEYTIVFSRNSAITKSVLIDTRVPDSQLQQIFSFKFKIELFRIQEGQETPLEDVIPIAKLKYSAAYEDFDYDPNFRRK